MVTKQESLSRTEKTSQSLLKIKEQKSFRRQNQNFKIMIPYKLILAIIMIESGGDPKAIVDDGKAFGILQIHQA